MTAREALLKAGVTPPVLDVAAIDELIAARYGSKDSKTGFRVSVRRKAELINQK